MRTTALRAYDINALLGQPATLALLFLLAFLVGPGRTQTTPGAAAVTPTNQSISAIDPRITYTGNWTEQDGGGHVFTGNTASFALNFSGIAVYWYSRRLYDGANVAVRLDDDDVVYVDLSAGTTEATNGTRTTEVEVLYEREGLDERETHSLNVSWNGPGGNGVGAYLENYRIQITATSNASETSSSATSIPASNSSNSNVGAIVGGTVGGIVGVAALILGMFLLWRRRERRADAETMQGHGDVIPFVSMQGAGDRSPPSSRLTKPGQPGRTLTSDERYTSSQTRSSREDALTSQDPARPIPSLPLRSPSSRFTFLPSWYRPRPDAPSNINPEELPSPVFSRDQFPLGRAMPVNPTSSFPPPPPSSAGTDIQEAFRDPPPVYRR